MEEKRNNRSVERKLKDCLRADRARIQVGRISHFGLLEMSRQRIRTGVLESSTVPCPHCRGTGQVRSIASLALQILRALEDHLLRHSGHHLYVRTRPEVALYVLNQKRRHLAQLEERFGLTITITGEAPDHGAGFTVERGAPVENRPERAPPIAMEAPPMREPVDDVEDDERDEADEERGVEASEEGREPRRRRRRRRGNGDDRHERHARPERHQQRDRQDRSEGGGVEEIEAEGEGEVEEIGARGGRDEETGARSDRESEEDARRRRRGRRGGRRRGRARENGESAGGRPQREDYSADAAFAPGDPSESEASRTAGAEASGPAHWDGHVPTMSEAFEPDPAEVPVTAPVEHATEPVGPWRAEGAAAATAEPFEEGAPSGAGETEALARQTEPEQSAAPRHSDPLPAPAERAPASAADAGDFAAASRPSEAAEPAPEALPEAVAAAPVDDRPKRSGWWNRKSFF
jgi:ribonuclease E